MFSLLLPSALTAQRPDTGPEKGLSRLTLEATLLGGAPAAEALEINGQVVDLANLRRTLADADTGADVDAATMSRRACDEVVLDLLRDDLVRRGAWLTDEDFTDAYLEYAKPYDSTPFTVKVVATKFKHYPSLEAFKRRWRVRESYLRSLPVDAFAAAALAREAEASRDLLTGTTIEVEFWVHRADPRDDGRGDFDKAHQLAMQTMAVLTAANDGAPVLPEGVVHLHLGEDRPMPLNQVRGQLAEGEYTTLLRAGVADAAFAAPPGKLLGPLRGSDGVYLARVIERHETGREFDLGNERNRELTRELLAQRLFERWVDEVFATSIIRRLR
ncbi:MAG: hypothetical protein KDC98_01905 [Planctomycetes bacterium]|nr:hypothetical protein [Planctomycetota bacterium]